MPIAAPDCLKVISAGYLSIFVEIADVFICFCWHFRRFALNVGDQTSVWLKLIACKTISGANLKRKRSFIANGHFYVNYVFWFTANTVQFNSVKNVKSSRFYCSLTHKYNFIWCHVSAACYANCQLLKCQSNPSKRTYLYHLFTALFIRSLSSQYQCWVQLLHFVEQYWAQISDGNLSHIYTSFLFWKRKETKGKRTNRKRFHFDLIMIIIIIGQGGDDGGGSGGFLNLWIQCSLFPTPFVRVTDPTDRHPYTHTHTYPPHRTV